jgi:hypothetical protein
MPIRYYLERSKREMTRSIESANASRAALVQLTSINFVNNLDAANSWVIPNDVHELQSGYPVVPSFLNKTYPFSEAYNEPTVDRAIKSRHVYLSHLWYAVSENYPRVQ